MTDKPTTTLEKIRAKNKAKLETMDGAKNKGIDKITQDDIIVAKTIVGAAQAIVNKAADNPVMQAAVAHAMGNAAIKKLVETEQETVMGVVDEVIPTTMFSDTQLAGMLNGEDGMINTPKKETIENQQSEAEKIMFAGQKMPEKDYGDEDNRPQEAAESPPQEGTVKGYTYKDNEVDPAFAVDPTNNRVANKLNREFEDEMVDIEKDILSGKKANVVGAIEARLTLPAIEIQVKKIIDIYMDGKEAAACLLYAEAVGYELRFVKPILNRDQRFFREIEDMGFVQIALMVKSLGIKQNETS
jgi:hypothetical protein